LFTGIIEGGGRIRAIKKSKNSMEIEIEADFDLGDANVGDSVSVNGCCLTITSRLGRHFWTDVSYETILKTTLAKISTGTRANLERAMSADGRFGGHMVQGHIDGVGKIVNTKFVGAARKFTIEISSNLSRYIVEKGSIAVDGVSLTVNDCMGDQFSVMIIPHTQLNSTFQSMKLGDDVNIEVDIIGKYVEKMKFMDSEQFSSGSRITEEFLKKHGF